MPTIEELLSEREELLQQVQHLQRENQVLRERLGISQDEHIPLPSTPPNQPYQLEPNNLSDDEKITLFRSLFKGRDDVYAQRWFSRSSGKSGYQPVCANEWNAQLCDKKKLSCAKCPNRQFAPLTNKVVTAHLIGKEPDGRDVIGLYAITQENNCYFLCADFDDKSCEHGFQSDVLSYVSVCKEWGLNPSIERSRSGNGAHVWLFFEKPILAAKARKLGNAILTEATNRDSKISFKSYDRFFPNQDTLPQGGLGNLVALPLQGNARRQNNSVFVTEEFVPYSDQWTYMQHITRVKEAQVDEILSQHNAADLGELSKTSESKPWETPKPQLLTTDDFPSTLIITRANALFVPLNGVSTKVVNHLKRLASFRNPEFYSRQAMHFSTFTTPRVITCAELQDEFLVLPRGCEDELIKLLQERLIPFTINDETQHGHSINVCFNGILRPEQEKALRALCPYTNGTLSATTAFGKTVTAVALIAKQKINTLILVHSQALLEQWKQSLSQFLIMDEIVEMPSPKRGRKAIYSPIGSLDSTRNSLHGNIDIALIQSCLKDNEVKPFVRDYGMVVVDECHHVPATNFEQVLKYINAQYVYGLTATPIRKDGHQPIIFMQCGPIRYTADAKQQIAQQMFTRELIPRFTAFRWIKEDEPQFGSVEHELTINEIRNQLIVDDVRKVIAEGRTPLVLSNLTSHVELLASLIRPYCPHVVTLLGSASAKEKRETMSFLQSISKDSPLVIVATGKYVGEGFDFPRLDTLFLTTPVSWKGIVAQYSGRLHRDYETKTNVQIYDYVDIHVPLCDLMYRRRLKGYAAVGYKPIGNTKETASEQEKTNNIYNGTNYLPAFQSDICNAKQSIVLSCQKILLKQCTETAKILLQLLPKGIAIRIIAAECDAQTKNQLEMVGFQLQIKPSNTLRAVVIDRCSIWYGGINYLSNSIAEDNAMRLVDSTVAENLLNILF